MKPMPSGRPMMMIIIVMRMMIIMMMVIVMMGMIPTAPFRNAS